MAIPAILENLRAVLLDCHHAAYADLDAGMVLATSSGARMTQEYWDGLCNTALAMLTGDVAAQVSDLLEVDQSGGVFHAILADGDDLGFFVRSSANPADALCCVCTPSAPAEQVIETMQSALIEIDNGS